MSDRTAEMIELKKSGKSYLQIAKIMGVSRQYIQQSLMDKTKRQELIESNDGTCDRCGQHSDKLDAHHEDYENGPTLLLCPSCHISLHNGKDRHVSLGADYVSERRTARAPEARMAPSDLIALKTLLAARNMTYSDWIVERLRDELRKLGMS